MKKRRITISVDVAVFEQLKAAAEYERRSLSSMAEILIEEAVRAPSKYAFAAKTEG